ncbi:SDR family oxidoreductase [Prolixibacteraceae bacterium Z1-6]|uniref:SDR family oxidoreductase n=1 Tax=Draconibacterium aestuarii TaxID=2998507 RepID=A0A9X3F7W3_9BACT|nr:SDR family oxidoreductase [Prolixibacteraceae bacterium Z1-6]
MNLFDIRGKVAVVTGGSGTLGGSISKYLAANGVKVAVIGRTQENVDLRLSKIQLAGGEGMGLVVNVLDVDDLKNAKDTILEKWGRIDILVNTAGGNLPGATLTEEQTVFDMNIKDFNKVTDLNLNGTVYPCLVFGEVMGEQKSGTIINISSMATMSSITRVPGYSVAKSGVEIFTKWLAMEMATKFSEKVRVNAIAPGFFISTQNEKVLLNPDGTFTERSQKVIAKTPMGRFGDIAELNGTIHYLCSQAASFVTGTIIPVDGGFSSFSGI